MFSKYQFVRRATTALVVASCIGIAGSALAAPADAGSVSTYGEPVWQGPLPSELRKSQQELHAWLMANRAGSAKGAAADFSVSLSPQDRARIGESGSNTLEIDTRRFLVGVSKPLNREVTFGGMTGAKSSFEGRGAIRRTERGFVWTGVAASGKAMGLRIHFTGFELPEGAAAYVYNDKGQAFGPYTGKGPLGTGEFWSHTVFGQRAFIQVHYTGEMSDRAVSGLGFKLADIAHLGPRFLLPRFTAADGQGKAFCSFNASCVENASCANLSSAIETARGGMAHILFASGGFLYICSGGLLNDTDTATQIPYFLTANHCISKDSEASSMEAYWDFSTECGGSCYDPDGQVPSTLGATILATGTSSDYTLMELSETPPVGSVLLGWTNTAVANTNGVNLFRISHPKGAPQAYSEQDVDTSAGTCRTIPRGDFIYSRDTFGATEGGSSGSPVMNASAQVVGQLFGACGTNVNDVCDAQNNATVDGALAAYYANVSQFLDPGDGGDPPAGVDASVSDITVTTTTQGPWTRAVATITVVDASGNPVPNATVSGTFTGDVGGNPSGVTDSNGVAVVESNRTRSSVNNAQFCVDNITGTDITYDSASNVEDCDSIGGGGGETVDASVANVTMSTRSRGPWTNGVATVSVVDVSGNPVPNATVSGTFSGDVSGSGSATTDSAGVAVVESDRTRSSITNLQFCVSDISGSNINFVSGANDCGSL